MFKKLSKIEKYFYNPTWALHELTRVVTGNAGGHDRMTLAPSPHDGENGGSLASMITSAQQRIEEHERFDDPVLALMTLGLDPDGKTIGRTRKKDQPGFSKPRKATEGEIRAANEAFFMCCKVGFRK